MNSPCTPDIHRIDIFPSDILSHIVHIRICILDRKHAHDNSCKTTTMNSADTSTDLIQKQLGKRQTQRDLLLLAILQRITVLQPLPGRITRTPQEDAGIPSPSLSSTSLHCICNTSVLFNKTASHEEQHGHSEYPSHVPEDSPYWTHREALRP